MADTYYDCLYPTASSAKGLEICSPSVGFFEYFKLEIGKEICFLDVVVLALHGNDCYNMCESRYSSKNPSQIHLGSPRPKGLQHLPRLLLRYNLPPHSLLIEGPHLLLRNPCMILVLPRIEING